MTNPQDTSKMVSPEDPSKIHMIQPTRFKVQMVKQLAKHDENPGNLPPIPQGFERVFTIRGVNDGLQTYPEYAILDVEPAFAMQICDKVFAGQMAHTGETLDGNAKHAVIKRGLRIAEYLRQFQS